MSTTQTGQPLLFLCFTFHHRALTVLANRNFPNVDVIEDDPVVARHVSLAVSLEVFNDGRDLYPPHQLPEGTVMMTIAVDNAAALGSDIFLEDSWILICVRPGSQWRKVEWTPKHHQENKKVEFETPFATSRLR
jgi:hypothetical protein